jgi:L-aspartate oxidase
MLMQAIELRDPSRVLVLRHGIAGLATLKASRFASVPPKKEKPIAPTRTVAAAVMSSLTFSCTNPTTHNRRRTLIEDAVGAMVHEGPEQLKSSFKSMFTPADGGMLDLGRENLQHSVNRIVHAQDLTGKEIERALLRTISIPSITIFRITMQ